MAYYPASLLNPVSDFGGAPQIGAPILYIVRHAEVDDDREGKLRGLRNQNLNENGERQLEALGAFFSNRPVFRVYTDDLSRTRATAMAIAGACGCEVETDLGLRSWDVGHLEGKSMKSHRLEIRDFKVHPAKVPTGGQSWGEFESQAQGAIDRAVRLGMESSGPICIVTHGSLIQILWEMYGGMEKNADYDKTPIKPAGVGALYLARDGMELKILRGAKANSDE